ncbi:MAG: hypothetical protein L0Y55_15445, partial [Anaerolineales bacterium]|nr:hypothetical protein [Anaerolineales bacterium]
MPIFQIPDYGGTIVTLGENEWRQKILSDAPRGHPEVADYLDAIQATIANPDVVFESTRRSDTRLFYSLHAGKDEYEGKHLVVVVKYVSETKGTRGYVSTIYLTRGLTSRGKIL